jgi:PAS domain S-box-containing protein
MEEEHKAKGRLIAELAELRQRVAELEMADAERRRAEEGLEHLNLVLRAIRNVNQLIAREKDRDHLLQGACESLIKTRGYRNVWIALLDESRGLVAIAEAGLDEEFLSLTERLKCGELTACGRSALAQAGVVVTEDPLSACDDCPLSKNYSGGGAMAVRLEHDGKVYGLLSVSSPADLTADKEEQALFQEVARDIAFALRGIELEEEHRRAEEAVMKERNLLHTLINNLPDYIYVKDVEGRFVLVNVAVARQMGFSSPDEVIGKSDFDLFPHELAAQYYAVEQEIIRSGQGLRNYEGPTIDVSKEEEYRWVSTTKVPLRGTQGEAIGFVGLGRDITERRRVEERLQEYSERLEEMVEERTQELRDAQEQLVRREKLAILGQLAGGVGHELRNPLGVISNAVYFLQMVLFDADESVKESLEMISEEVCNSAKIISDLLDFSRTRMPDREEVVVSELVAQVLEKRPPPGNVEVITEIAPDLPPVFVDPRQMGQVLGNLVTNVYQAMKEGGNLTFRARAERGQVSLSVADTGCGIPPENMTRLFEPLFTTKTRGIGLGLAVSKSLVEANEGSIEVESEEGRGSTFTVKLPIWEGVA